METKKYIEYEVELKGYLDIKYDYNTHECSEFVTIDGKPLGQELVEHVKMLPGQYKITLTYQSQED